MRKLCFTILGLLICAGVTQTQVVEEDLVSYWTFDADTIDGNTARDIIGQSHGEFEGKPQTVPGKFGEGLEFDGSNRIKITEFEAWDWVDSLTVDLWINPSVY